MKYMDGYQIKNRIKVAWICHFSNARIQNFLKPWKKVKEYAPWICVAIEILRNEPSIELHIISPHRWIYKSKSFNDNGVMFHFFNPGIPLVGRHWPSFFPLDIWTNYYSNKKHVARIVRKIKPNLIHLWGAENAYYSSTVLQFKNRYPTIIGIQGFVEDFAQKKHTSHRKKLLEVEKKILTNFSLFQVACDFMKKYVQKFNHQATFFYAIMPNKIQANIKYNGIKEFDLLFYARITKSKGIENLLEAISKLRRKNIVLNLLVMGPGNKHYINYLKELCNKLNIKEQIHFKGFMKSQKELFEEAIKAKIYVLPAHKELLASSVRECMFLKIPVIVNNVGCFSILNEKKQCVLLTKPHDINDLAGKIEHLIHDTNLYKTLKGNAYERICELNDYDTLKKDTLIIYKKMLAE